MRIVFEPVFVPALTTRSFAAFATIQIARAERRRIACEIDVGILFRWSAGANQRDCDQQGKSLHCKARPCAGWRLSSRWPPGNPVSPKSILPCRPSGRLPAGYRQKKRPIREETGRQTRKIEFKGLRHRSIANALPRHSCLHSFQPTLITDPLTSLIRSPILKEGRSDS